MTSDKPAPPAAAKQVSCPTCGGASVYAPSNAFRPFCSERCKNVDLGAWASESFRMPVNASPEDQVTDDDVALRSSVSH